MEEGEARGPAGRTRRRQSSTFQGWVSSRALTGLFVLATLYTLYFASDFLLPIVLASIVTLVLQPVVRALGRLGLPAGLGAALLLIGLLVVGSFGARRLLSPAITWVENSPAHMDRLERRIEELTRPFRKVTAAAEKVEELATPRGALTVQGEPLRNAIAGYAQRAVTTILITLVLVYFLLVLGRDFVRKLVELSPRFGSKKRVVRAAQQMEQELSVYLATITLINAALGVAVGFTMWMLGVPSPALWGLVAAVLNFMPYLGALTGVSLMAVVALLSFEQPTAILLPPLAYLALTSFEGYFVTPTLLGRRLPLHPIVILLSVLFWTWMWGLVGAVLAVPLVASFKIVCDQARSLRTVGALLGR